MPSPNGEPTPHPRPSTDGEQLVPEDSFLDDAHQWSSSFLSDEIFLFDSWFGDADTLTEEIEKPWLRARIGGEWKEHGVVEFQNQFRAVIPLPLLERKLGVFLGSDSDDEYEDDQDFFDREDDDSERDITAGLRYRIRETRDFKFTTSLGMQFTYPPVFYVKPRLQYTHQAGRWLFKPVQYFYYYTDDGLGTRGKLEIDRYLGSRLLARSYSQATYSNTSEGLDLSQEFSLQYLNFDIRHGANYALALEWESTFHTWPSFKADRHLLTLRCYRSIWRPWLRVGLAPRLTWERLVPDDDDDFTEHWRKVSPSLIFFVEVLFEEPEYDDRSERYLGRLRNYNDRREW